MSNLGDIPEKISIRPEDSRRLRRRRPIEVSVMDVLVTMIIALAALVLFDLVAFRFGVDSRGGFDAEQFRIPRG